MIVADIFSDKHSKKQECLEYRRYDPLSETERSKRMSLIKEKDTKPELLVRKLIFSMGYRYRLHDKNLPGKPDIVFKSRKKAIFVHGCFWHQHGCSHYRMPKTKQAFWEEKLAKNVHRDNMHYTQLKEMGWDFLVLWECGIKKRNIGQIQAKIGNFLGSRSKKNEIR